MGYNHLLDLEKDYQEIKKKLNEFKELSERIDMDLSAEIAALERKLALAKEEKYRALSAWQRCSWPGMSGGQQHLIISEKYSMIL